MNIEFDNNLENRPSTTSEFPTLDNNITPAQIFNSPSVNTKSRTIYIIATTVIAIIIVAFGIGIYLQNILKSERNEPVVMASINPSPIPSSTTPEPDPTATPISPIPTVCLPKKTFFVANGTYKVLVVPTYFSDVKDEYGNHNDRISIYADSFKEINTYLKVIQNEYFGKELLKLEFTLSDPIIVDGSTAEYDLDKNSVIILQTVRAKLPSVDTTKYHIIVMRALSKIPTSTSGYSSGNWIWMNLTSSSDAPIPEDVSLIKQGSARPLHVYRGVFTSLMLHEILHSFGLTDLNGTETYGPRYNLFYKGGLYDGSQELVEFGSGGDIKDVTDELGILQQIGPGIRSEIGWVDSNGDGIIDAEQICTQ